MDKADYNNEVKKEEANITDLKNFVKYCKENRGRLLSTTKKDFILDYSAGSCKSSNAMLKYSSLYDIAKFNILKNIGEKENG